MTNDDLYSVLIYDSDGINTCYTFKSFDESVAFARKSYSLSSFCICVEVIHSNKVVYSLPSNH